MASSSSGETILPLPTAETDRGEIPVKAADTGDGHRYRSMGNGC